MENYCTEISEHHPQRERACLIYTCLCNLSVKSILPAYVTTWKASERRITTFQQHRAQQNANKHSFCLKMSRHVHVGPLHSATIEAALMKIACADVNLIRRSQGPHERPLLRAV